MKSFSRRDAEAQRKKVVEANHPNESNDVDSEKPKKPTILGVRYFEKSIQSPNFQGQRYNGIGCVWLGKSCWILLMIFRRGRAK